MFVEFLPSRLIGEDGCNEAKGLPHLGEEGVPSKHGVVCAAIRPYPHSDEVLEIIDAVLEYEVETGLEEAFNEAPNSAFLLEFPIVCDLFSVSLWPNHYEVHAPSIAMWAEWDNEGFRWRSGDAYGVNH